MIGTEIYHSLRFRIISGLAVLLVVSAAGFYYLQTTYYRLQLVENLEKSSGRYLADIVKGSLMQAMQSRDLEATLNILETVQNHREVMNIYLANKDGQVVVSPDKSLRKEKFSLSEPTCEICHRSDSQDRPMAVLYTDKDGRKIIRNVSPILNESNCHGCHESTRKVLGVLITDFSLRGVEEQLGHEFSRHVLSLAFFLFVVIGGLSIGMDRLVLTRIKRFVLAAKRFGGGDFSQDIPDMGKDEIGKLAAAFNQMAYNLRQHITSLEETQKALRDSEEKTRSILKTAADGIITINEEGIIQSFNPAASLIFGYSEQEVVGQNVNILMPDPYNAEHDQYLSRYATSEISRIIGTDVEVVGRHKGGTTFPMELAVSEVCLGQHRLFTGIVRDISDRKEMEEKLYELATHDSLTGLYNRTFFTTKLEEEFNRAVRHGNPLSLMMLDIDHFKLVNDTYGHQGGDAYLHSLAELVSSLIRNVDILARYGGEELIIILPDTGPEEALVVAERLKTEVGELSVTYGDQTIQTTISIGVASLTVGSQKTTEELLKAADSALYAAKQAGRNCVVPNQEGMELALPKEG